MSVPHPLYFIVSAQELSHAPSHLVFCSRFCGFCIACCAVVSRFMRISPRAAGMPPHAPPQAPPFPQSPLNDGHTFHCFESRSFFLLL
jgi:hypothetical protein